MLNIKDLIINAALLITIIYVSGLIYKQFFDRAGQKIKNTLLVFLTVFSGWISMLFGIRLDQNVIFDLRFIPVIVAAMFVSNPVFVFLAGFGIGLARLTFGANEAAISGFYSMVILSLTGVLLLVLLEKASFYKKMLFFIFGINTVHILTIGFFEIIPFENYFAEILPVAFPVNICLTILVVWVVNDLNSEYTSKLTLIDSAQRDPLTKLYNRRAFMRYYKQFINGEKGDAPFVIAFIDIDHFKKVNDTYGHLIGDMVLQTVSARILHNLRNMDIIARYGGEEFVIILPDCTKENAFAIINRIRERVESHPIHVNNFSIPITLSAGLAGTPDCTADHLLKLADDALYKAKRSGRNKVICAEFEAISS